MGEIGPLTNGQLIIGSTGNSPVASTLASADGSISITNGAGAIDLSSLGTSMLDEDQIYYVGKHGNDAWTGLNIDEAVLTFGQALTLAIAALPTSTNRFAIVCLDDGIYTENITCVQYVDMYAPNAKLVGTIVLADDSNIKFRAQDIATGTIGLSKLVGSAYSFVEIDDINIAGNGIGLLSTSGFTNLTWKTMYIASGFGVGDLTSAIGHIHIKGGDIYISDGGYGIARANAGTTVGRIDHILDISGGNTATGIIANAGSIDIQLSRIANCNVGLDINGATANIVASAIDCVTAYDISSGELYLHTCYLNGTETSSGGTRAIVSAEDGINGVTIGDSFASTGIFTSLTDTARTEHAIAIYGASGLLSEISLTDGQLLIGSTGADPVAATLTQPAAGLTIAGAAGSVTFALADDLAAVEGLATTGIVSRTAANTWIATTVTQHAVVIGGASEVPAMLGPLTNGQLVIGSTGNAPQASTLTAGAGIAITNAAGSVTISSTGSGLAWEEVTDATKSMAVATAYGANRAGGVTFTLPSTCAAGSVMEIIGMQGLWSLAENAGQTIYMGNTNATITTGTLTATNAGDCITLRCITTDTDFRVIASMGNITIT